MSVYLAIDIGASSGRHIVGYLQDGKLACEEVYRFANGAAVRGGELVWDTDRLFEEIVRGLKAAKEKGHTPDFIGIDTWAVDYALLGKNDELISPVYCYRDGRGEKAAKKLHGQIPFEKIYERNGIQYQPFNTVYQLFADRLSGRLEKAESMLMLPDYFHWLLTGVKKQEYTNATSTALVKATTHTWDEELVTMLGYPKRLFGELSKPGETVGRLLPEIASEVGYEATVILPATHDTASAVLAAQTEEGSCYISSGTWSLLGVEVDSARTDPLARGYNYSNEGSINFGFRFQKNIMGLWMIQQVRKELGDKHSFAFLAEEARKRGEGGLVDVNDNRFLAPESMIAEIEKACGRCGMELGELAHTVFDSLALCYEKSIVELEKLLGREITSINIMGGGCNNGFLNELTAKRCRKKIIAGPSESTALGNLVMQMIAAGEIENLAAARRIIRKSADIKEVTI